jgi:hypothetical protein
MTNDKQYEKEAQNLSSEALAKQVKLLEAIKAEAAWRKRNVAKIDAGIVALAEAKDDGSRAWIEDLRQQVIGRLRAEESVKKQPDSEARKQGDSIPEKGAADPSVAPESRPVQTAGTARQAVPVGAPGITPPSATGDPRGGS